MQDTQYQDDGVANVIKILKDTFGDYFKEYYDGEPENIPESMLPCVMVIAPSISVQMGATGTDTIEEEIRIIVNLNKKDDLGAQTNDDLTMFRLRKLIMGQKPGSQDTLTEYHDETFLAAIRRHITLGNHAVSSYVDVEFEQAIIGINDEGVETWVQRGYITIRAERQALIPSRD